MLVTNLSPKDRLLTCQETMAGIPKNNCKVAIIKGIGPPPHASSVKQRNTRGTLNNRAREDEVTATSVVFLTMGERESLHGLGQSSRSAQFDMSWVYATLAYLLSLSLLLQLASLILKRRDRYTDNRRLIVYLVQAIFSMSGLLTGSVHFLLQSSIMSTTLKSSLKEYLQYCKDVKVSRDPF